jgi:D-amino-acid oxidase
MKNIWFYGTSYIIPNVDSVVIGGTSQKGNWCTDVSIEDSEGILNGVRDAFPSLINATVITSWAGLRPGRTPLRCDSEIKNNIKTKKDMMIGHCYGHGGSGITLSWGCAEDIVLNHILPFLSI